MTAEDILKRFATYVTHSTIPIYLHKNAIEAMEEYASERIKELEKENDRLTTIISTALETAKENDRLRDALEKKIGGWVSANERLPEKGQWCLIYCWRGIMQASFWTHYWKMHELSTGGHEFTLEEVSHWQPLPKPPESALSSVEENKK